ncbi:MAG: hypothetical protein LAT68_01525 [Cyclobacteriaceae bacterium]|nr:hypothetical protein [Cyclobacteriaceae bacterium]MCH8514983.1 hypothetical protein [Cyclobacteriaceae bacterium]
MALHFDIAIINGHALDAITLEVGLIWFIAAKQAIGKHLFSHNEYSRQAQLKQRLNFYDF